MDCLSTQLRVTLRSYPAIYDLFFRYLEVIPPSHTLTPEAGEDIELALISIYGILRVMGSAPIGLHRTGSHIGTKLLRSWPSIWRWMSFLYSISSLDEAYSSSTQISMLDYRIMVSIVRFISSLSVWEESSLWKAIAATPGVFTTVVKLWMVQLNRKADDPSLGSDCSRITCNLGTF